MMIKTIGKYFLITLVSLLLIGGVYQGASSLYDAKHFLAPGEIVTSNGIDFHVKHLGTSGPTVVFDAGMGDSSLVWAEVADRASLFANVFVYDRAGLGWSEDSELARTSSNMVDELHQLLIDAKVEGPYILVGQSFGGANMQLFAKRYPELVAGLVLVDSVHEEQLERLPSRNGFRQSILRLGMMAAPFGVPRMYLSLSDPYEQASKSTVKHQYTSLAESKSFAESLQALKSKTNQLRQLPLTVIARNKASAELASNGGSKRNIAWAELQEQLAASSNRSELIFSGTKYHMIHRKHPELVVQAIERHAGQLTTRGKNKGSISAM